MEKISAEEYATAVEKGVRLALHDSNGSMAMAQVLLSCYNGSKF